MKKKTLLLCHFIIAQLVFSFINILHANQLSYSKESNYGIVINEFNGAYLDSIMPNIYNFNFAERPCDSTSLEMAYYYYWKGLSGDHQSENLEKSLSILSCFATKNTTQSLAARFLEFRVLVTQEKKMSAILTIKNLKTLFINTENDSLNPIITLYWGVFHYFVGYARQNYPILKFSLLGWPEADMEKGIQMLEQLSLCQSSFLRTEASYFLCRIYSEFENNPTNAIDKIEPLTSEYERNTIFSSMYLNLLKNANQTNLYHKNYAYFSNLVKQGNYTMEQRNRFYKNLESGHKPPITPQ